jgi:hypothetical protein
LRTSEATDLSCHLWQVVFAPLRGAPSVVSRGTGRGDRSHLPYEEIRKFREEEDRREGDFSQPEELT